MGTNKVKECIINSPDEDTWNKHKDLLRCLYFDSTLSKLMDHMKQHFNFTASYIANSPLVDNLLT